MLLLGLAFALPLAGSALAANSYTGEQVALHNTAGDCWTIVNSKVYNVSAYVALHPGGQAAINSLCGLNGSTLFNAQHSTNAAANAALAGYYIGDLSIPDISAPSVPTNLTAQAVSTSQINLQWTAATDNVALSGYRIFRDGIQIATTTTTGYVNTGLATSTTYSYSLKAYDTSGNTSALSASTSATTLSTNTNLVEAPTGLVAVLSANNKIKLSWNAASSTLALANYRVLRDNVVIATTSALNYIDFSVSASSTHAYTITALDIAGNVSAPSAAVSITTAPAIGSDTIAPSAPTNLVATLIAHKKIKLTWARSTDNFGVWGYKILRDGLVIGTSRNQNYQDKSIKDGLAHTYTVIAFDRANNLSAASNAVAITAPIDKEHTQKARGDEHKNEEHGNVISNNNGDKQRYAEENNERNHEQNNERNNENNNAGNQQKNNH